MMEELAAIGITEAGLTLLVIAAFFAGFIDSMAGGGGLVTLPAALVVGVPPHIILGSTKFMASLGTAAACVSYAKSGTILWRVVACGIFFSLIGASAGAKTVLFIAPDILEKILILLLPLAAFGVFLPIRKTSQSAFLTQKKLFIITPAIALVIGFYDGFYGPGTGSFLLLAFHLWLGAELVEASATAKPFNLASNISALIVFLLHNQVFFTLAIPMALANIAGNLLGSKTVLSGGPQVVRKALCISLSLLFFTLLCKYYK